MVNPLTTAQSTVAMRRWGLPAIVTLVAMAALTALTAGAAARPARPATALEAIAPREAGEPIMAIVSIKSQQVTFYDADGWILRAPVSTGITGRETPAGVFAVIEKDKDHHSTLYDDAWMPNMQRIEPVEIDLHAVRQRFIGGIHVGEQRVAAARRALPDVEDRAHRRLEVA